MIHVQERRRVGEQAQQIQAFVDPETRCGVELSGKYLLLFGPCDRGMWFGVNVHRMRIKGYSGRIPAVGTQFDMVIVQHDTSQTVLNGRGIIMIMERFALLKRSTSFVRTDSTGAFLTVGDMRQAQ